MKSKYLWRGLLGIGILFMLSSLAITLIEYHRFQTQPIVFPSGSSIAGVPVGELDQSEARDRISDFYSLPLAIKIENAVVYAHPEDLGFVLDVTNLVDEAIEEIKPGGYWNYLWNNNIPQSVTIPLSAAVDEQQLADYLTREIIPRYTQPGSAIEPIPATTNFKTNQTTTHLDLERAITDIRTALMDPDTHTVTLHITQDTESTASIQMLMAFLQHNINWIGFDELIEIYLEPMSPSPSLHFALQNGTMVEPDIAFTAASTIKIPIMISVLRRVDEPTPDHAVTLLKQMIALSENPPADTLMSTYLDEVRGPLIVSEALNALGLDNTFLAGYFYLGAPVLQIFETPANSRTDIFLDPDLYNQTTPAEAGRLLSEIYTCAEDGGGLLTETFPGEISQTECQLMVEILSGNQIGLLIEAGLPPEAAAAHKHGWVQELDGMLRSMSDAAIVFTPEEDYVLTIFIYDTERLDFDEGNRLFARLSQTVYNFFNLENQAHWWFD